MVEGGVQGIVRKWDNGAAVRVPAAMLAAAKVQLGQPVDVREEGGRIIIEPLSRAHVDIHAQIAGINGENRHDSIDMGAPVGQEVW
jgi:antitoxin MazE